MVGIDGGCFYTTALRGTPDTGRPPDERLTARADSTRIFVPTRKGHAMKNRWKNFLGDDAGAEFADDIAVHYGNPERELEVAVTGLVFADLGHLGVISVHGKDATAFLQGQLSNDVNLVDESHSQLSAYCTPKGRILGLFRLFRRDDTFYLRLPLGTLDAVLERLRRYVLRAEVTLEDATDNFIRIGVTGKEAAEELSSAIGRMPEQEGTALKMQDLSVLRVPGVHPRFEVYALSFDAAKRLWDTLNVRGAPVGLAAWQLTEIQAGLPNVYANTAEQFIPQMLNLQLLDGVSFRKGCYPGQEIVARTQYLGALKRRMYAGRIAAGARPSPGDALYTTDDSTQAAGQVVDAQPHPDGGYAALAVLQIGAAESGDLHLGSSSGPVFLLETLPYPFAQKGAGYIF
jgi:folate-binding protein YgfZ